MSWPEFPRSIRLLAALGLAALVAGCFQPLYGDRTVSVGTSSISDKLSAVEVAPVKESAGNRLGRVGVEMRDQLLFNLTGGGPAPSSAYRLEVSLTATQLQVIVDINSARPEIQNYGINANYVLIDNATGKPVVRDTTFARVSYNIPGQQQRFAGDRGLRDAENRAAKVIADNIRNRLASYFTAGTCGTCPGRSAAQSGALLTRDPGSRTLGPGSAVHRYALHRVRGTSRSSAFMTAIKAADVDRFIARPDPALPIVLVYGPDAGLVRERVDALVKASVDDPNDPFAFVRIEGEDLSGNP
ncbi:MAG: LPS assembly lipoprotein LptE, partial [Hyphomicrobium sp.]|nr:LPS assembly lipoprotein LptE [Hyphomicrobium sp.]